MGIKIKSGEFGNLDVQKLYGLCSLSDEKIIQLAEKYSIADNLKPTQSKIEHIVNLLHSAEEKNLLNELMSEVPSVDHIDRDVLDDLRNQLTIKQCYSNNIQGKTSNVLYPYIIHNLATTASALDLQGEINTIRQYLKELQQQKFTGKQNVSIQNIEKSIDVAAEKSAELTANIILPPRSSTDVHLVPTHSLERYIEYKADENIAFLLTGLFGGAAISVLVNWATNDAFKPNVMSTTLLLLFVLLTLLFIGWLIRIHLRIEKVSKIFQETDND
jgi:hypothetical protein